MYVASPIKIAETPAEAPSKKLLETSFAKAGKKL